VRTYHTYQYDEEIGTADRGHAMGASGYHEYDPRYTATDYDWSLKQPITSTVDPAGLA